ncbi:MAG: hypothetical protein JO228_11595 [Xanthobacteraceae bacterium]|nr:hypothetical protein [Xanthobacteraceae bacterium]
MRIVLRVRAIWAGPIAAALAIAGHPAAADCLGEPNRDAPAGQHWYYHLDHGSDRKCWYLHATVAAGTPDAMELQSVHSPRRPLAEPQRRPVSRVPAELPRRQVAAPQRPALRTEADEAALYLEFLRWKERHRGEP